MSKLKCLIVDDEELARDLLENFVQRLPHLELVGKAKNPVEALAQMQQTTVDVLLLDIQMPELTGLEFLKSLPQKPLVILTTAYAEFALEGYELDVVDYLLKPFSFERFVIAINKAAARQSTANVTTSNEKDYLLVKSEHKVHKLRFTDIRYIQSMREYVAYYLPDGRLLSLNSLKQLEKDLPADQFMRIHKSYIVAIERVKTLEGNLLHLEDTQLPIGANYREEVLRRIF